MKSREARAIPPPPRRLYVRLALTPREAGRLYAQARKRKIPIAAMVRSALGLEPPPDANSHWTERAIGAADRYRLKVRVSHEERRKIRRGAREQKLTLTNYLRAALKLASRQNRVGAPEGNRKRALRN